MKENPKILVLDSDGQLGSEIMRAYPGHDVTGWTHADLDVTDEQAVWDRITAFKPDLVYNCAAYGDVDRAEEDRVACEELNAYAPGYIAKTCKSIGAVMVHFSSGMVFDGRNPEGYSEEDSTKPVNAYGRSKLAGELEAAGNLDELYVIRTGWLFGPLGAGTADGHAGKDFVAEVLAMAGAGEVALAEDETGNPTYSRDLAQASAALVEMDKPFGIYHIVNTGTVSRLGWGNEIFSIKKLKPKVKAVKGITLSRTAVRPQYEVLNNTKFIPLRPWTEALAEHLS